MTRQPDIKSTTKRLTYIPVTIEEEKKSDDFKSLCIQDGLKARDLLNEAIDLVFKAHHWPPGNPQLTLQTFASGKPVIVSLGKCSLTNCNQKAIIAGVEVRTKKEYKLCKKHYTSLPLRHDPKVWQFKEEQKQNGGLVRV
jgi:hypothetical protein